ncbi:hypothetical protein PYE51_12205 [Vibrio aestuarianus]|uniref:Uncharacterized protein n=1 Tax=Vibrio aestuarianus TaxID=28171 RepID=A0AAX3U3F9_9VIBR|nr:hypothetical protein [Vibrio aestuarianus]WGK81383.1 hypothetical protein PYE51_12205 [Vibrio aestuarianus]
MLFSHVKDMNTSRTDTAYHRIIVSVIELYQQYGEAKTSIRDLANHTDVSSSLVV